MPSSRLQFLGRGSKAKPEAGEKLGLRGTCFLLLLTWLWVSRASPAHAAVAAHLESLATLHAVSGDEEEALAYIRKQLGAHAVADNTGSLTATFGAGSPHKLLIAGVDEPGYVVSGVHEEGYLRLERLADPAPHYQFDRFFLGQSVSIRTSKGVFLSGSVAAPAVHFDSGQASAYRIGNPGDLYVDIGAASPADVLKAGVGVLDSVALEKRFIRLGRTKASAPWISSRAGAAILLELASRLAAQPPAGRVTLAFVTRQHHRQQGLLRVLQRLSADEVVLLRPGGDVKLEVTRAPGASSATAENLLSLAREGGWDFERGSSLSLDVGPFGPAKIFNDGDHAAVVTIGVEHAGTPVEVIQFENLDRAGRLLAKFVGTNWQDSPRPAGPVLDVQEASTGPERSSLEPLLEELVEMQGVSRSEARVREKIRERLPLFSRRRSFVDEKGNLVAPLGGEGKPRAIFIAHMDEIGYEIDRIDTSGRVVAKPVGGLLEDLFAWRPVVVHAAQGPMDAIMTSSGQIDLGAASGEDGESFRMSAGNPVTVRKKYRRLLGTRISGRSLDDRVGCAVLIASLGELSAQAVPLRESGAPVWLVFSVEEEIGLLGAAFVAGRTAPPAVYAIDSFVTSDSPLEDRRTAYAALGAGFVIRAIDESGIVPRQAVARVTELATRRRIPVQAGVTAGGNDGSRFVTQGAVNIPLSWPLRYAHTASEVADLRDIEALVRITTALIEQELSATAAN